jgi:hypothetical protein
MDLNVILWHHGPRKDFSGRAARKFAHKLRFKPFKNIVTVRPIVLR